MSGPASYWDRHIFVSVTEILDREGMSVLQIMGSSLVMPLSCIALSYSYPAFGCHTFLGGRLLGAEDILENEN